MQQELLHTPLNAGDLPYFASDRQPLNVRLDLITSNLSSLLSTGKSFLVACSFGKDSSVLLNLVLEAGRRTLKALGYCSDIIVVHSNTLLENPVMHAYALNEMKKVRARAVQYGLPVRIEIVSPSQSANYLTNMIGGRSILVTGAGDASCSVDLKITPIKRFKRALYKQAGVENVITLLGTRFDESSQREKAMYSRGESDMNPVQNKQGDWILSPIAALTTEDIFTYIGRVRAGSIPCYSDFDDLVEVYRGANGNVCDVLVHLSGGPGRTACGARTGCWICGRVNNDKSMSNMLEDERYSFMRPLHKFRQYLVDTLYDPGRRDWLGKSIDEFGQITVQPNTYSPQFCEELLRLAMSIDAEEQAAAAELGIEPRFQLLTEANIIAIELMWARYGGHAPAQAMLIYEEILSGQRYPVPELPGAFPKKGLQIEPVKVMLIKPNQEQHVFQGLRDVVAATANIERTTEKSGKLVAQVQEDVEFTVDEDGAALFFTFELERFIERYGKPGTSPTQAVHYFMRLGTVRINKGGHLNWDRMLRRGNRINELGLQDVMADPSGLLDRLGQGRLDLPGAKGQMTLRI